MTTEAAPARHSPNELRAINQAAAHLDGVLGLMPEEKRALARTLFAIAGNPRPANVAPPRIEPPDYERPFPHGDGSTG